MASQRCNTIPNDYETEEIEQRETYLQNRLLSLVGTNQPSDIEFVFILLGLFFTEYASLYRKRYSGYHNTIGRPCIHILIPLIFDIIKEFLRCSDRMLIIQIPREGPLFEALGGKEGRPLMGERTLYESRNRLNVYEETEGYNVKEQFYSDFTQFLMGIVGMDPSIYRMDSTLIDSCIRKLSRNMLIFLVIRISVRTMAKLALPLPSEWEIFLQPDCGMADVNEAQAHSYRSLLLLPADHPTDKMKRRATLLEICLALKHFGNQYKEFQSAPVHILLQRVIGEQTEGVEQEGQKRLMVRSTSPSGSLQSPFDPDAQCRIKGKQLCRGYVCNLVEARDEVKRLSILTHVNTQGALHSDKDFGVDYISNHAPEDNKTLYFDGGYNCHEVREAAKERTIDIHPTDMLGRKENPSKKRVSGFKRGKDGKIHRCPGGKTPDSSTYQPGEKGKGKIVARFHKGTCGGCKFAEQCAAKPLKRGERVLRTTDQSYSTAEQRDKMEQPGYKEKGNRRAAVEGVCSSMKNRFQAAKMKVRGKTRVARAMMAKGSAYNLSQAVRYLQKKIRKIRIRSPITT
ncbi:transposase [Pasteuria penetrans]|uniref:transposase n=1 Tax=Pasteuria penetrans TaxID=86005 RepID=UPI000F944D90|nr:transposase [Pasteuria penetrans]